MVYKRVVITQHGSSEVLKLMEDDLPHLDPDADAVRIKVRMCDRNL